MGGVSMFCTKCGQEQTSETVRFCSQCGFKFSGTDERLSKRLITMAMYLVLTICAIIGWGSMTAGPGYMQVRIVIILIAAITFYLLFSNDLMRIFRRLFARNIKELTQIASASQTSPLRGAHTTARLALGAHRVNTAEIVQPPSVTEQTTVLLDKRRR